MGVDLTLCPDKYGEDRSGLHDWFLAHTRIDLHRDYQLQEAIRTLPTTPLPPSVKFDWYDDEGIKHRTTDAYGSDLTYLTAQQFASIPPRVLKQCSQWNQAVITFCQNLTLNTRVVLWWH